MRAAKEEFTHNKIVKHEKGILNISTLSECSGVSVVNEFPREPVNIIRVDHTWLDSEPICYNCNSAVMNAAQSEFKGSYTQFLIWSVLKFTMTVAQRC